MSGSGVPMIDAVAEMATGFFLTLALVAGLPAFLAKRSRRPQVRGARRRGFTLRRLCQWRPGR